MARKPRTGMERLLRLRDVQIANVRQQACAADSAVRKAEQQVAAAHGAVTAFGDARHAAHAGASLDLARYRQLLDGEQAAAAYRGQCEADMRLRRHEAEQVAEQLQERMRQRKAVENRHDTLRCELQKALDSKSDGQLCELWQNTQEAPR